MQYVSRRQFLSVAGGSTASLVLASTMLSADREKKLGFTLPKLPYPYDALEPHIDARTMQIHHDKHHRAYVDNLNKALEKHPALLMKPIDDILKDIKSVPKDLQRAVINNGGGHANHTLFWEIMKPKGGGKPSGTLAKAIDKEWGSVEELQKQINDAGLKRFGSGWAWLVVEKGKLRVVDTGNQNSPLMEGMTPILGVDVWEHAYYLKYQNRRADYLKAWWNVVNWDNVAQRYHQAIKG